MIFVDPRFGTTKAQKAKERLKAFCEALTALGVESDAMVLPSGDFLLLGNGPDGLIKVGVELKTVHDFVTSMLSGHLVDQLERMHHDGCARLYVIVEGFYRARRPDGLLEVPAGRRWRPINAGPRPIYWDDVEKFITTLEEAGVRVRKTRTTTETARTIGRVLFGFWAKDYDDHKSLDIVYSPPALSFSNEDEATRRIRRVLVALKAGVGVGRSKAVAKAFKSVYGLATADAKAWEGIDGIGRGIAAQVVKAVREEIKDTGDSRATATRCVSARSRSVARSTRDSRQRTHDRMAASRHPERRLSKA